MYCPLSIKLLTFEGRYSKLYTRKQKSGEVAAMTTLRLSMEDSLKNRLTEAAHTAGRSISEFCADILGRHLAKEDDQVLAARKILRELWNTAPADGGIILADELHFDLDAKREILR